LGVVRAEAGMVGKARSAATAAIRESERTQGHAVLGLREDIEVSLELSFGITC
jgi:hypothetical protein